MRHRGSFRFLIDVAIIFASAIAAFSLYPAILGELRQHSSGALVAGIAAAALRIAFYVFVDLTLRIEISIRSRVFYGSVALLVIFISLFASDPSDLWLSPFSQIILNIFIVALIMARQLSSPQQRNQAKWALLSPSEVTRALSRYGAREEFTGTFVYLPLPPRNCDADTWTMVETMKAHGILGDRSWRVPAHRVPNDVAQRFPEEEAFQVFRVRTERLSNLF